MVFDNPGREKRDNEAGNCQKANGAEASSPQSSARSMKARQFRPVMTASGKNIRTCIEGGHSSRLAMRDAERAAGVGIIFSHQQSVGQKGSLVVESILANGAASGVRDKVRAGDILAMVDGVSIDDMEPHELGTLILGPKGSTAVLEFDRVELECNAGQGQGTHHVAGRTTRIVVDIVRSQIRPP